jgi:hypothetical protein
MSLNVTCSRHDIDEKYSLDVKQKSLAQLLSIAVHHSNLTFSYFFEVRISRSHHGRDRRVVGL